MYVTMNAHPLTVIIIVSTLMITPLYMFATFAFSGASRAKGMRLGVAALVMGAFMFWVCIGDVPRRAGLPGNLIVPAAWIIPSLLLLISRHRVLSEPLSQRWLIGLQLFRSIGALFLLEMARGKIPGIFAYPAGVGDVIAALVALAVLVRFGRRESIPRRAVALVIIVGVADLLSAFFFGFFSSETPVQLFFPAVANNVVTFPTGLIPLFLVLYAIFFHVLSGLNQMMHGERGSTRDAGAS
ncbi:MAG: hypothetical protein AB1778_06240 [Candidatus Bipolaricaulota bacterium]